MDTPDNLGCQVGLRQRRIRKLAAVIAELPAPRHTIAILCCDKHREDGYIAAEAVRHLGSRYLALPIGIPPAELATILGDARASVLLACSEGTEIWWQSGAPIVVVGDGPGVRWWRMAELQAQEWAEPATPCSDRPLVATVGPSGRWQLDESPRSVA